jgi:alpha-tubulin suppressor-like RCC1 family protein/pectin methylesterase-like acyl-CoA thioesterase
MHSRLPRNLKMRKTGWGMMVVAFLTIMSLAVWGDAWDPADNEAAGATLLEQPTLDNKSHGPHKLESSIDVDWFKINVVAGQTYYVRLSDENGKIIDGLYLNSSLSSRRDFDWYYGHGADRYTYIFTADETGCCYFRVKYSFFLYGDGSSFTTPYTIDYGITEGVPPEQPSAFHVRTMLNGIHLDWVDESDNEVSFLVERQTAPSREWISIATLPADAISYRDATATGHDTHTYRVASRNPPFLSAWVYPQADPVEQDEWDPLDDEVEHATLLANSESTVEQYHGPHTISSSDEWDWFKMNVIAGKRYNVRFESIEQILIQVFESKPSSPFMADHVETTDGMSPFVFDFTAEQDGTYYFRVDHINDDECDYDVYYLTAVIPETPSAFHVVNTTEGTQLTWVDESDNEDGFVIYRRTASTGWQKIATLPADSTTYLDTSATGLDGCKYQLASWKSQFFSSWVYPVDEWDPVDDVMGNATVLGNPEATFEQNHGPHIMSASDRRDWFKMNVVAGHSYGISFASEEFLHVELRKGSNPNGSPTYMSCDASGPFLYRFTADQDDSYYFLVEENTYDYFDYNVCYGAASIFPNPPSKLHRTTVENRIQLTWEDNSEGEDAFVIQRRISSSSWESIATLPANSTDYVDMNSTEKSDYRMASRKGVVFSEWIYVTDDWDPADNTWNSATLLGPITATEVSHGPHVLGYSDYMDRFKVELTAGTSYEFNFEGFGKVVAELSSSITEWTELLPEPSFWLENPPTLTYVPSETGVFYLQVRLISSSSAAYSLRCRQLPGPKAPPKLEAVVIADGIQLTWEDLSDNEEGFTIARRDVTDGVKDNWTIVRHESANITSWLDTEVSAGRKYQYRICSHNSEGTSLWMESILRWSVVTHAGPGGIITPAGETIVVHKDMLGIHVIANQHYHITSVINNGRSVSLDANQSSLSMFMGVGCDRSISATFEPNTTANGTPEWWLAEYDLPGASWEEKENSDSDGDGLAAWEEYKWGTSPVHADSDFNGIPDWTELSTLRMMGGGSGFSAALMADGTVQAAGVNWAGQLGDGSTAAHADYRVVPGLSRVKGISAEMHHTLALDEDGQVWGWGGNSIPDLGISDKLNKLSPFRYESLPAMKAIAAGAWANLGLTENGDVWVWGAPWAHMGSGAGQVINAYQKQIKELSGVMAIASGSGHCLALKADGTVMAWGNNNKGQLGDGGSANRTVPVAVMNNVVAIEAFTDQSMALKRDGTVWAWGANDGGQLGIGSVDTLAHATPVLVTQEENGQVGPLSQVLMLASGYRFSVALKRDGTVWAWGVNDYGMLGDGTLTAHYRARKIPTLSNIRQIVCGNSQAYAIDGDGNVWGWGCNGEGQVTGSKSANVLSPRQLTGLNVKSPSIAIVDTDDDGLADGWELLYFGRLGKNGDEDSDGDSLTDDEEYLYSSDPTKTDGDGLSDIDELNVYHTSPSLADTDKDGLPDGWELDYNLDPLDETGVNGATGDVDGDGFSNLVEWQGCSNPNELSDVPYFGSTWYVDGLASAGGNGASEGKAFQSIQAALDRIERVKSFLQGTQTVSIGAGTYRESIVVKVSDLILTGAAQNAADVVVDVTGLDPIYVGYASTRHPVGFLLNQAKNVTIQHLTITGAKTAWDIGAGIWIRGGQGYVFEDLELKNCAAGIRAEANWGMPGPQVVTSSSRAQNCYLHDNSRGIMLNSSTTNFAILDCTILKNNCGIWLVNGARDTLIKGNVIGDAQHRNGTGIQVSSTGPGTQIVLNSIVDNEFSGIAVDGKAALIAYNNIHGNDILNHAARWDLRVDNPLEDSMLPPGDRLGLSQNWFGTTDPAALAAKVTLPAGMTPDWSQMAAMEEIDLSGGIPWYVEAGAIDGSGKPGSPVSSIQSAVNTIEALGARKLTHTVYVGEGTYPESVTINGSFMEVVGAGQDASEVVVDAASVPLLDVGHVHLGQPMLHAVGFFLKNNESVTLANLTVRNANRGTTAECGVGVWIGGGQNHDFDDLTVANCTRGLRFESCKTSDPNVNRNSLRCMVRNSRITGNVVGLLLNSGAQYCEVFDNDIVQNGAMGIWIVNGSRGHLIKGNRIGLPNYGNGDGIGIFPNCHGHQIIFNSFCGNLGNGLMVHRGLDNNGQPKPAWDASIAALAYNNFSGNRTYDLNLQGFFNDSMLPVSERRGMTGNWFGTTDLNTIQSRVYLGPRMSIDWAAFVASEENDITP